MGDKGAMATKEYKYWKVKDSDVRNAKTKTTYIIHNCYTYAYGAAVTAQPIWSRHM